MNNKIYARQVPPEYQESPLCYDDLDATCADMGIILTGNRSFNAHTTPEWDNWQSNATDAMDEVADAGTADSWYKNATEALNDLLPPTHKKSYSTHDVAAWKKIFAEAEHCYIDEDESCTLAALYLMTGKQYEHNTICGCCQSDWQDMYSPDGFNPDFVRNFEIEYFNTGTEWIVHDEEDAPESPEDISGYSMYCYTYNPAEEIAQEGGVDVAGVVLYEFDGYAQSPRYRKVKTA